MSTNFDRGGRSDGLSGSGHLTPVPSDSRPTGLTYEPFYGLKEKPFSLTSDSRFFYQSRSHAPAFDDLLSAIRRRESLNVLTGDIGTGKTTLCRAVLPSLDRKTFSAFVPDPFASREELLKILLTDFGVASIDDVTSGRLRGATRTELSYLLYEFLGTLVPLQAFAVVVIDEAQNLSQQVLEEVRILSDADGQLQVVLVGQLELRDKLRLPEMRQLDQRVSVHCQLQPLDCAGVAGYISHRLRVAGGSSDRVKFTGDAVEAIYDLSGGVPRIINRACDRALRYAYSKRDASIDAIHVLEANMDARPVGTFHPAVSVQRPTATSAPPAVVATAMPEPVAAVPPTIDSEELSKSFLSERDVLPAVVHEAAPPVIVETVVVAPVVVAPVAVAPVAVAPVAVRAGRRYEPVAVEPIIVEPVVVAPVLPVPTASVALATPEPLPVPSPSPVAAAARTSASAEGALPAKLELWLSKIESETEPIEEDWRERWTPTNAVAEPSPEIERRSGVRFKIPMVSQSRPVTKVARVRQRWTRRLGVLAVGLIIALGAAVSAPAAVAASIEIWSEIDNQVTPPRTPDLPPQPAVHAGAPAHVTPPADPLEPSDPQ